MKKKKGRLHGQDTSLLSTDDAFYLAESWFKSGGKVIGKQLGLTPKQIKRKNTLLKTVKELESKGHFTHSTWQRNRRILQSFQKPMIDVKISKLRKVLKRFPVAED